MTLGGKRILIVEDEYLIAMNVASEIAELGGKVVGVVGSADDALDVIAATDVDGAIIDITLTGGPTFQVADALAARHIPFVFMTGVGPHDAARHHSNAPWLEKPFTKDALRQALESLIWPTTLATAGN
jgi:CheY-like chemotaxis protein